MQIYIFKNNEQFGPFDAAQIEEYIKTNIFDINDFAWSEGEAEWIPLSDLLLKQSQIQDVEINVMEAKPAEIQSAQQAAEIKILTKHIAKQFLKDNDSIHLSEFTVIEPAAAQVLARHTGELKLSGLTSLSEKSAMELCNHKGLIWLCNLKSLSNAAAEALVQSHWEGHRSALFASKNVEMTLAKAKARVEAQAKAQAQAQARAEAKALAEAKAQAAAKASQPMSEKAKCGIWCVSSIIVCLISVLGLSSFNTPVSDAETPFLALTLGACFISGLSSIISLMVLGNWDNGGAPSNETIALIQRQQMINKLNDIRNELKDE
jgi:hypothetical protein